MNTCIYKAKAAYTRLPLDDIRQETQQPDSVPGEVGRKMSGRLSQQPKRLNVLIASKSQMSRRIFRLVIIFMFHNAKIRRCKRRKMLELEASIARDRSPPEHSTLGKTCEDR